MRYIREITSPPSVVEVSDDDILGGIASAALLLLSFLLEGEKKD